MSRILAIGRKEFVHIFRDPRIIMSVFGMPLIQLILFSYALNYDITNIPTAILDQDKTTTSRQLIQSFSASGYFAIDKRISTERQIDDVLTAGTDKVVIKVPTGFADKIAKGGKAPVQVLIDGSDPNTAQTAAGYSAAIAQFWSGKVVAEAFKRRGLVAAEGIQPIEARLRVWYNPDMKSVNFLLPGLIAIIMMNIAIVQTAMAVVREKEYGTIEQLIASPVKRYELMIGKIGPYLGIAIIDIILISLVGIFLFGVPFRGSIFVMAIASALFIFGSLGLGLIISTMSSSLQTANQMATFLSFLPGFMLSGFVFPIRNMPVVLQWATYLVPARYYLSILRGVFLKGTGPSILWPNIFALVIYSTLTIVASALMFKKKM
ncbi:MAG: ABC transporter permease [Actinobacteria bacterium]|nr:MAG: ABC transporter permease [Actinomycetota bacterium]